MLLGNKPQNGKKEARSWRRRSRLQTLLVSSEEGGATVRWLFFYGSEDVWAEFSPTFHSCLTQTVDIHHDTRTRPSLFSVTGPTQTGMLGVHANASDAWFHFRFMSRHSSSQLVGLAQRKIYRTPIAPFTVLYQSVCCSDPVSAQCELITTKKKTCQT